MDSSSPSTKPHQRAGLMHLVVSVFASLLCSSAEIQAADVVTNQSPAPATESRNGTKDQKAGGAATEIPSDAITYVNVAMLNLGLKLGAAALGEATSGKADENLVSTCRALCKVIGVELPPFQDIKGNPVADKDRIVASARALNYLLSVAGPKISEAIKGKHGRASTAAFELGLKSMIGTMMFEDAEVRAAVKSVIERRGKESGLPDHLWLPLTRSLVPEAERGAYVKVVVNLCMTVQDHLAKGPKGPQKG